MIHFVDPRKIAPEKIAPWFLHGKYSC